MVLIGDRIWYVNEGVMLMQCVARTQQGRRCRRTVDICREAGWSELRSRAGVIAVYNLSHLEADIPQKWFDQHCDLHDLPDVADFASPGWELFDSVRHPEMVAPLKQLVAEYERKVFDGVTDRWEPWSLPL